MATLHMSAPWVIFYREVQALFAYDPEVHILYDEAENHIKLFVEDEYKAAALAELLPTTKTFGNVELKMTVFPPNGAKDDDPVLLGTTSIEELFDLAFTGNGAYAFTQSLPCIFSNNVTYVVFKKRVVQYWTDDLGDYYGQTSTLYQNIARDVFGEREGVFYSTDIEDPVYKTTLKKNWL